jgi:hypothetical protein
LFAVSLVAVAVLSGFLSTVRNLVHKNIFLAVLFAPYLRRRSNFLKKLFGILKQHNGNEEIPVAFHSTSPSESLFSLWALKPGLRTCIACVGVSNWACYT